jgi:hypothetical protein
MMSFGGVAPNRAICQCSRVLPEARNRGAGVTTWQLSATSVGKYRIKEPTSLLLKLVPSSWPVSKLRSRGGPSLPDGVR